MGGAMILLVVGLVAVIAVIAIAVVLSVRLGRGDDHDELDTGPASRDRRRPQRQEAPRWQGGDSLVPPAGSRSARPDRYAGDSYQSGEYAVPAARRGAAGRSRDYDHAALRPARAAAAAARGAGYGPAPAPWGPGSRRPGRQAAAVPQPRRDDYAEESYSPPAAHADFPSGDYPAMGFARDEYPSGDIAVGDYPSADFPSDGFPVPEPLAAGTSRNRAERPAAPTRGRETQPKAATGRRKPAKPAAPPSPAGKSRARQRSRRDAEEWPGTEWDSLSDEQYWAELSADKPLASMTRGGKAGSQSSAPPQKQSSSQPTQALAAAAQPDLPRRRPAAPEPATQQLPARRSRGDRPRGGMPGARAPEGTEQAISRGGEPRSRGRASRGGDVRATDQAVSLPREPAPPRAVTNGAAPPSRDRRPSRPHGALDEDPLTSPSLSWKTVPATDSRSYRNSRKHARPEDQPAGTGGHAPAGAGGQDGARHASDPLTGSASYRGGEYPAAAATDPGRGYSPAPPATGTHASWYPAPATEAQGATSPYGNPYESYGAAPAERAAGYDSVSYPSGYPTGTDSQYPQPAYTPPAAPYAAPPAYQPPPPAGVPAQYGGSGYLSQSAGYPVQPGYHAESPGTAVPQYSDGYQVGGYENGYETPYTAGGYGYEG
jgi:hypothetical protein